MYPGAVPGRRGGYAAAVLLSLMDEVSLVTSEVACPVRMHKVLP